MKHKERWRRLLALSVAALLGLLAVVMVEANRESAALEAGYRAGLHELNSQLAEASAVGYTQDDLTPVGVRLDRIRAAPEPVWVVERPRYYEQQRQAIRSLSADLRKLKLAIAEDAKSQLAARLADADAKVSQDRQLEVDAADLQPILARLDQLTQASVTATKVIDYRSLTAAAAELDGQAVQLGQAQIAENNTIKQGADDLKAKTEGNLDAIRKAAQKILADARDDASVEGFLAMRSQFVSPDSVMRPLAKLEKHAAQLVSTDLDQAAFAASAVARYASQVHEATMKGMPGKTIVVYVRDQYLVAYDHGQQALATVVTTGRPELPTDIGAMKLLYRQSPFVMRSPWPKDSPYWYPDSPVRRVMWFTPTGEGFHDAPWRSAFGPGTNVYDGTHGCINMPGSAADALWNFAPDGTPVIVIPGTGETQSVQLAQDTIDTPAGQVIKGA